MSKKLNILALLVCVLICLGTSNELEATPALAHIRGFVYEDVNGNGQRDPTERGLAGIHISDGQRFVTTAKSGQYRIQVTQEVPSWVAITQPNGFRTTTPFYWTVSGDNSSLNFGLQSDPDSLSGGFSFIHGADIQYELALYIAQLQYDFDTMEQLSEERNVRFYTCVGDLTSAGVIENLQALRQVTAGLGRPFYAQFGGHDGLTAMDRPKMGNYVDIMGPYAYSWNYGGIHFISLVSESHFLSEKEQQRQKAWLDADLARVGPEKPIVVLTHIPGAISSRLAKIAKSRKLLAVLQGHWHIHNLMIVGETPVFTSGPWRPLDWGAFTKRVRVISFEDGDISSATRVLGQEKRIIILSPTQNSHSGDVFVAANIYDTVLVPDKVVYQVSNESGQEWSSQLTQRSDWTWAGTSGLELPTGTYQISITASAGEQNWSAQREFTITAETITPRPGNDWTSVFGPPQGSSRTVTGIPTAKPSESALVWIQPTGTSLPYFSSPVVANGRIYLGLTDGQVGYEKAGVICLDAVTGAKFWHSRLPGDVLSSVVAQGGNIYALTGQGQLFCLNAITGDPVWNVDIYAGTGLSVAGNYAFCMNLAPLTTDNGLIYVAAQGSLLACYVSETGKLVWNNTWGSHQVAGLGIGQGMVFAVAERRYVAFDALTGKEIWRKDIQRERGTCTPIFSNGAVYLNYQKCLIKANPIDGRAIWTAPTDSSFNYMGIPAVSSGKVVISKAGAISAFDEITGEPLWKFETRSAEQADLGQYQVLINGSSPALYGDCVFVGGDDGYFYILDLETGEKKWEHHIGTPIKASPAISGNMVFIPGFDGNIYAFAFPESLRGDVKGKCILKSPRFSSRQLGEAGIANTNE